MYSEDASSLESLAKHPSLVTRFLLGIEILGGGSSFSLYKILTREILLAVWPKELAR